MGTFHEEAGKGSWKRPREVSKETYESNWDRIFKNKDSGCSTESEESSQEDVPVGE